jgi:hypothetical protein
MQHLAMETEFILSLVLTAIRIYTHTFQVQDSSWRHAKTYELSCKKEN